MVENPSFSPSVRSAVAVAQREAAAFGESTIRPEHVMLALAGMDDQVGAVLRENLDIAALRVWVADRDKAPMIDEPTFAAETKAVFAAACTYANAMQKREVDAIDLLLGMVADLTGWETPPFLEHAKLDRRPFARAIRQLVGDAMVGVLRMPDGAWRYRINDAPSVDPGALPLMLALDAAFRDCGVAIAALRPGTDIRVTIREPGSEIRHIDLTLGAD